MNPVAKKPVSLLKAFPHISGTMEFFCEPQNTDETASRTEAVFQKKRQTLRSAGNIMSNVPTKDFQNTVESNTRLMIKK